MSDQSKTFDALLIFSIGPVQDFIAAARRTQDLWMGSFLLAYLASRALKAMQQAGAQVLYPALEDQPLLDLRCDGQQHNSVTRQHTLAMLPNKFTIAVGSLDEGEALARHAKETVRCYWREITQAVRRKFPANLRNTPEWDAVWTAQTEEWLEIYWAVTPRSALPAGDQASYGALHSYAQRAFDARKGLRNFASAEEHGEKCTVCAIRSALRRAPGPRKAQKHYWRDVAAAIRQIPGLYVALDAEGNERLCAICTVKRFAQHFYFEPKCGLKASFPSTSSVATALFRYEVVDKTALAANTFVQSLKDTKGRDVFSGRSHSLHKPAQSGLPLLGDPGTEFTHYDGDLLFEETYTERKLRRDYGLEFDPRELRTLRAALDRLLSQARLTQLGQPPRYYAVLAMDGDEMGKKLNKMDTIAEQKAVSDALRRFATDVQRIVEGKGGGRVVYVGGDDVLALLPLDTALKTADDLRRAYEQLFQEAPLADNGFTLSGGIAIAHHQAPLSRVLAEAREAEHAAKDLYGRDALCVVALKRSGEPLRVGAHWQEQEKENEKEQMSCDTPTLVDCLCRYFREPDKLSSKFAYEAYDQARGLALSSYKVSGAGRLQVTRRDGVPRDALQSALHRLAVQRHRGRTLAETDARQLAEDLAAFAVALDCHWCRWIKKWYKDHQRDPQLADAQFAPHPGAEEMGRWLLLARFLERGGEQ